jgi:phosphoribosylformylglycinamidine synthase
MIVGIINGVKNIITLPFKESGNDILIVGETEAELGGSEYHSVIHGLEGGIPPKVDEEKIQARWNLLFELYQKKLIKANHVVKKGGFIISVAEMCFKNKLGVDMDLTGYNINKLRDDELLFSETVGRFIIETNSKDYDKILGLAEKFKVAVKKIGVLTSKPEINIKGLDQDVKLNINKMKEFYDSTIPDLMEI